MEAGRAGVHGLGTETRHVAACRPAGLLIDWLATYRLAKLVRGDRIIKPVREAVESRHGQPETSGVSRMQNCPWCLACYFGAAFTAGSDIRGRPLVRTLSAMTGLVSQYSDQGWRTRGLDLADGGPHTPTRSALP